MNDFVETEKKFKSVLLFKVAFTFTGSALDTGV